MKIACLSGKGGAGKTFIAVNLAAVAGSCTYIDCDVEEPNGGLFFKPEQVEVEKVHVLLPEFDAAICDGCKQCVSFCKFHALVYIKEKPMLFDEVCHSCGGCKLICKKGAVTEVEREVGVLELGVHRRVAVVSGILHTGEASGVPVIHKALEKASNLTVIDCPPGSACSVMESVMEADYCVLVAEASAFGFHNVKMVHELVSLLGKKCGIIINKELEKYEPLEDFCEDHKIEVLDRIEYDSDLARRLANGEIVVESSKLYKEKFEAILTKIRRRSL